MDEAARYSDSESSSSDSSSDTASSEPDSEFDDYRLQGGDTSDSEDSDSENGESEWADGTPAAPQDPGPEPDDSDRSSDSGSDDSNSSMSDGESASPPGSPVPSSRASSKASSSEGEGASGTRKRQAIEAASKIDRRPMRKPKRVRKKAQCLCGREVGKSNGVQCPCGEHTCLDCILQWLIAYQKKNAGRISAMSICCGQALEELLCDGPVIYTKLKKAAGQYFIDEAAKGATKRDAIALLKECDKLATQLKDHRVTAEALYTRGISWAPRLDQRAGTAKDASDVCVCIKRMLRNPRPNLPTVLDIEKFRRLASGRAPTSALLAYVQEVETNSEKLSAPAESATSPDIRALLDPSKIWEGHGKRTKGPRHNPLSARYCTCNYCTAKVPVNPNLPAAHISRCSRCAHDYCARCNKDHAGSCDPKEISDMLKTWREASPCPTCHVPIVRSYGCDHIDCTHCGAQFSILSGKPYTGWGRLYGNDQRIRNGAGPAVPVPAADAAPEARAEPEARRMWARVPTRYWAYPRPYDCRPTADGRPGQLPTPHSVLAFALAYARSDDRSKLVRWAKQLYRLVPYIHDDRALDAQRGVAEADLARAVEHNLSADRIARAAGRLVDLQMRIPIWSRKARHIYELIVDRVAPNRTYTPAEAAALDEIIASFGSTLKVFKIDLEKDTITQADIDRAHDHMGLGRDAQ